MNCRSGKTCSICISPGPDPSVSGSCVNPRRILPAGVRLYTFPAFPVFFQVLQVDFRAPDAVFLQRRGGFRHLMRLLCLLSLPDDLIPSVHDCHSTGGSLVLFLHCTIPESCCPKLHRSIRVPFYCENSILLFVKSVQILAEFSLFCAIDY